MFFLILLDYITDAVIFFYLFNSNYSKFKCVKIHTDIGSLKLENSAT